MKIGIASSDVLAGLACAALMLPEGVAYAAIAGLPPARALIAATVGCAVYAAAGRSRFAIVSPTSSSAAILAGALASLGVPPEARAGMAMLAVLFVGLFFLAAALLRLGALASFVSRPVLRGFAFGLAVTIALRQLPAALGLTTTASDIVDLLAGIATHLHQANPPSAITAALSLAMLLGLRRFRHLPAALLVVIGGIVASVLFHLGGKGVALVGPIAIDFDIGLPRIGWAQTMKLAQLVLPMVLILFAESWGTIRSLGLAHGDRIEPGRELAALGLANLATGLAQSMPVGAGFSASAANEAAGATSRWSAAVAAMALAIGVLMARPWIALLPQPVLAAVVVGALTHALDPAPLLRLWQLRRDPIIAATAALGVLALGVINGMLLAILLSVIAFLHRMAAQTIVRLGQLPGTHNFVDIARHPDAVVPTGIAVWRPVEPLFFANAEPVLAEVARQLTPDVRLLVLSLEESYDLDSTALDALVEFDRMLASRGLRLLLGRARDPVRDLLTASGATDLVGRSYYSVADAAAAALRESHADA